MPHLVLPSSIYKKTYLEAVAEYQKENLYSYLHLNLEDLQDNFEDYIQNIHNEARGIGLPTGYVPHTIFWLIEDQTFLGRVDIRHELNEFLKNVGGHIGYDIRPSERKKGYATLALQLAITEAKKLNIPEILVTCDKDNTGSNKIIQKNGGKLLRDEKAGEKNRYIINT